MNTLAIFVRMNSENHTFARLFLPGTVMSNIENTTPILEIAATSREKTSYRMSIRRVPGRAF